MEPVFGRSWSGLALAALALAAASVRLPAQQPYAQQPYGYGYGGTANGYGSQYGPYPAPPPQYNQPQPQAGQSPYAQPQYAPPSYGQPAYPQQPYNNAAPTYGNPQQPYPDQSQGYGQPPDLAEPQSAAQQQPLDAGQLEQLVAPVALYPDNLLALVLAASTYPAQVSAADQWLNSMRAQGYGSPDQIAAGAEAQTGWDPSIKALTAFPQVLDMMNQNLEWTTALGNAYYNQPQDVMQTVQVLRQRAQQAGNLVDTPQQEVTDDQGYLEVAPANPEVVYVPTYNPWYVYGPPISPYPGFSLGSAFGAFFGSAPIRFGLGIAMAAFDRTPFGWSGWALSWLTHALLFHHANYMTRSTTVADWGLPHGGERVFGSRGMAPNRYRTPQPYRSFGNSFAGQPGRMNALPESSRSEGNWRMNGYTHPEVPGQQAYNRMPAPNSRPAPYTNRVETYPRAEGYSRPSSEYNQAVRPAQSYAFRPAAPYQSYRSPSEEQFPSARANSSRNGAFYGGTMARNEKSGGFHFGNGHESNGFGGGRMPKSFRSESLGGGRAPKGFGHQKAPKESRSGGHGHKR
jgi:Protein of unknown function (DUF3300)